ncbi:MAG: bifunctional oligoribonuclease/PAP phosphatase NrnA [Patescibacteria group bacterium]
MIYKKVAPKIWQALKDSRYPLVVSHENPDGDTLGASLALLQVLENENKHYQYFCQNKPPDYFNFLPKIENLIWDYNKIDLAQHDLIIAIDCGDLKRTGLAEKLQLQNQVIINIDHHHSNDNFGQLNLVIPQASSTSEIVYNLFNFLKIPLDKYMATNLLTGILTDTTNFTNAATSTASLKISAELLKIGARINQIIENITHNKNFDALKLWGNLLDRIEYNAEYNFAYTTVTLEDLINFKMPAESFDGLANFLSSLQTADFILVLSEEDHFIKGSLRTTRDEIDVSRLAQAFNGGGHKKAAGFKIPKPQNNPDWKDFVLSAILNKLRNLKSEIKSIFHNS